MMLVLVQCPLSGVGVDGLIGTSHMGPGGIFELGEVNARRMCANATNK